MSENNMKSKNKIIILICMIICSVLLATSTIMQIIGTIPFNSINMSPISSVNCIIQIFNIHKNNIYIPLSSICVGILYIYMLVHMIKGLINVIIQIFKISKAEEDILFVIYRIIRRNVSKAYSLYTVFIILTYAFSPYDLNTLVIVSLIIPLIAYIVLETTNIILNQLSTIEKIESIGGVVIISLILVLLYNVVVTPAIYNICNNFSIITASIKYVLEPKEIFFILYYYLLKDIIYLVLLILFIRTTIELFSKLKKKEFTNRFNVKLYQNFISMIVISVILIFVNSFVENGLFLDNINITYDLLLEWIQLSKNTYLPIVLLSTAGLIWSIANKKGLNNDKQTI